MPRYFLQVSYKGTGYSGFQVQDNATTIQSEIEKALLVLQREMISLTGSSRTDAGVHALQNYFHFDSDQVINTGDIDGAKKPFLYRINSILPPDIVIKQIVEVAANAHCRFDAISREYKYYVYAEKNPFLDDRAYYFPYTLDMKKMHEGAALIRLHDEFAAFSKKNTQAKTTQCKIYCSEWLVENECVVYHVEANRYLRGMVRALVATMLKLGRGKIDLRQFEKLFEGGAVATAEFAAPAKGLQLVSVKYGEGYFGERMKVKRRKRKM